MSVHVLDASAVIAYLDHEAGHERMVDLFEQAAEKRAELIMTAVNWGEVLYAVENVRGEAVRDQVGQVLAAHPIEVVDVKRDLAERAARLKSTRKLPYADCFAAALAQERKACLVTCDLDFRRVEREVKIVWLERARGGGSAPRPELSP